MPKSKLRGGKKAHRKKVEGRNEKIKSIQNRFRNIFQEEFKKELELEKKRLEETKTEIVEVNKADTQKEGV